MTVQEAAQHVFDVMAPKTGPEDMQRIKDAFLFAQEAHKGQRRNTGEPYIIHPIAVATIVAEELDQDSDTVIAAFLHDVVEDTDFTLNDIRATFGDEVAFLVDVVTKRKKKQYENTKQVDNYKQILDSVHYDIRALLVKLSDRLHNMRTLDSMRPDKQMKIAGETDFFYAPLAGRLGLYHVKSELENLSFRFRCPREYQEIQEMLDVDRERTMESIQAFTTEIDRLLEKGHIVSRTSVRYRKPYSIWREMKEHNCDFAHVDFKHYVRVVYSPTISWGSGDPEKDTALSIYSLLSSRFKERPGSVANYIDNPKDNGYQSFHVKLLSQVGVWEELHIASTRMHINSKLGCVVERDEGWLERFKAVLKSIASSSDSYLFMEGVSSSLYNEDIIAFTPHGKGVILPKGATALDFAFELHTELGERAQYARINGKLSPIKTELFRGDCVEIGTNEELRPNQSWLNYARTYKARHRILELLKRQPVSPYGRCSVCHPLPGDEVIGYKEADGHVTVHSRHCPDIIKLASGYGDSIVSVQFEANDSLSYPVRLRISAIDRYHLLRDIIDCFVESQHLSLGSINSLIEDEIVTCTIAINVHSADELSQTIRRIAGIPGVDEVQQIEG